MAQRQGKSGVPLATP
jgi:chromosome segregation ATPase